MAEPAVRVLVDMATGGPDGAAIESVLRSLRADGEDGLFAGVDILLAPDAELPQAVDPSWQIVRTEDPVGAASRAFQHAASAGSRLLVLLGTAGPGRAGLAELGRSLERDPFFGFALPRVSLVADEFLAKLDERFGDPEINSLPASVLSSLPESELVDDVLFGAVLIDADVVRDFEPLDTSLGTVWGSVRELMARARRVGFRTVLSNRSVVRAPGPRQPDAEARVEEARLAERYPEIHELAEDWAASGRHEHEALLARCHSASVDVRRTLIVDLTDLGAMFNGTSEAVIGLLWGLKSLRTDWRISLWVAPHVVAFHGLDRYFPEFKRVWPAPTSRYTAVFRPIQPWSIRQVEQLHRLGFFVFVMMFDTILHESRVGAPVALGKVWETLARTADGLFYISRFTRDRFRMRFPVDPSVSESVTLLSTHPGDFCEGPTEACDDYLFVVGNQLAHKWLEPTIRDLAESFPYQPIKALGFEEPSLSQLSGIPSGHLAREAADRLYRDARLIVFPSQYEGFGIPIVRGLAHGKTVVARRTELLEELAGHYRGPGTLHAYTTRAELVERVAEVLHGVGREGMPLGGDLAPGVAPPAQSDVAGQVLALIEDRVSKPHASNWRRRQELFEFAAAHRICGGA